MDLTELQYLEAVKNKMILLHDGEINGRQRNAKIVGRDSTRRVRLTHIKRVDLSVRDKDLSDSLGFERWTDMIFSYITENRQECEDLFKHFSDRGWNRNVVFRHLKRNDVNLFANLYTFEDLEGEDDATEEE